MKQIVRNKWISVYAGVDRPGFRISPASYFDNRAHFSVTITLLLSLIAAPVLLLSGAGWWTAVLLISLLFGYGHIYLYLPIYSKYDECDPPDYGFYLYSPSGKFYFDTFVWCWGRKTYHFYMPWSWQWVRTGVLLKDGTWETETKGNRNKDFWDTDRWKDKIKYDEFTYTYTLKNGTIQNRIATVKREFREWKWRWFMWLPWPLKRRDSIDVSFNDEVGERTGTWKGGTVGCGYDIFPGETVEQCLRRMERDRKF